MNKRILVTISFSFSIRYIVRTGFLEKLRAFAEPVVILTWHQLDLIEELDTKGFEVHVLPETSRGKIYLNHRRKIDYWFNAFRLKSPTRKIQVRFLEQYAPKSNTLLKFLSGSYNVLKMYLPGQVKKMLAQEEQLLLADTNYNAIEEWVTKLDATAVFTVTPFHSQEDIFLRACKNKGLKMLTAILSFDNITKRGWIPVAYDAYMVWNKYNLAELHRIYPLTQHKEVTITGAPQFDFYFQEKYLLPLEEWKQIVGLENINERKIILYAGGPQALFPNEPQYLKHIDEAISNGKIEGNPIVLFRCHPVDKIERWKEAIGNSPNIVFDSSWTGKQHLTHTNIMDEDIAKLCSTLAHTDVHVNLCSTMTVDGSIYNKPQIGPAYDDIAPSKASLLEAMYWQEHFIPIMKTNGLSLARSKEQLVAFINEALHMPQEMTKASKRIVDEIITFSDGKSTERLIGTIKNHLSTQKEVQKG
jgi:hypothetical protein